MLFNNPLFIGFFLLVCLIYLVLPIKWKKIYLLFVSLSYVWMVGGETTVLFLLGTSMVTFFSGLFLDKFKRNKLLVVIVIFVLTGVLIFTKYTNFIFKTICAISRTEFYPVSVVAAIGVSYYVFSALSYVIDIYRGDDNVETNIIDLLLWLSFFPKFIAGPIERHGVFKKQLQNEGSLRLDYERIKKGFLIMAWGYFQKIVIADRIGIMVDSAYSNLEKYSGFTLLIVMLLYSIQIYADFAGYSNIAYGMAKIMGLNITQNFLRPYFSGTVNEFWRRWHISLSSWLRDYIYIPLGGNRKGEKIKNINLLITFLVSGIWHGASWNYILWGGIHGIYQIIENFLKKKKREKANYYRGNVFITFFLVSIAWVFFRAISIQEGFLFFKRMLSEFNPWIFSDGTLTNMGIGFPDWIVLIISLFVMLTIEKMQESNIDLYSMLSKRNIVIRWICYYVIIIILLVFGIYGTKYNANNFIYFQY